MGKQILYYINLIYKEQGIINSRQVLIHITLKIMYVTVYYNTIKK